MCVYMCTELKWDEKRENEREKEIRETVTVESQEGEGVILKRTYKEEGSRGRNEVVKTEEGRTEKRKAQSKNNRKMDIKAAKEQKRKRIPLLRFQCIFYAPWACRISKTRRECRRLLLHFPNPKSKIGCASVQCRCPASCQAHLSLVFFSRLCSSLAPSASLPVTWLPALSHVSLSV